jgi:hypothetical protein
LRLRQQQRLRFLLRLGRLMLMRLQQRLQLFCRLTWRLLRL